MKQKIVTNMNQKKMKRKLTINVLSTKLSSWLEHKNKSNVQICFQLLISKQTIHNPIDHLGKMRSGKNH